MGEKLKDLSSEELITVFRRFGFEIYSQKGSHIKLRRQTPEDKETIIIPRRKSISKGTLHAIFQQALAYIPKELLHSHFYYQARRAK